MNPDLEVSTPSELPDSLPSAGDRYGDLLLRKVSRSCLS